MHHEKNRTGTGKRTTVQKGFLFFAFFCCLVILSGAQDHNLWVDWQPEGKFHYGFIFPHTTKIDYLIAGHVPAFEVSLVKTAAGDNLFDRIYNYPRIGFGFFHADLNNPRVLGTANSLIAFLNAPVFRTPDGFQVDYQITGGMSYLTRIFGLYDNNVNVAIGSHLNLHFTALVDWRIRLFRRFEWLSGVSFSHFSNGRVELPNLGLNYVSAFTGISYRMDPDPVVFPERIPEEFRKHNEHILVLSFGVKQYEITDESYYLIQSFSYDAGRQVKPHIKFSAGPDLFFDGSSRNHFDSNGISGYGLVDLYNLGFHGGIHFSYRKLTLLVMAGHYLYRGSPTPSPAYSRIGLQHRFRNHFLANVSLKSHNAIADFIEWGIGYSI